MTEVVDTEVGVQSIDAGKFASGGEETSDKDAEGNFILSIDHDPDEAEGVGFPGGNSGKWGAVFNFVNTIVGAGIIGLPFAVKQCGFVMGMVLLCLTAYLVDRSAIMLVAAGTKANSLNYEELMLKGFGPAGLHTFCFFAWFMAFGAMAAYMIIIADTIPEVMTAAGSSFLDERQEVILVIGTLCILPLSLLKDMSKLAFTSAASVFADFLIILIVLGTAPGESRDQNVDHSGAFTFIKPTLFAGLGAISFAFVCQSVTFLVYRSLREPSIGKWSSITHNAIGISWSMTTSLAVIGYLSFVEETEGDILNNFATTHGPANAARFLLALTMTFTYPMEMFVARHVFDASIFRRLLGCPVNWHYNWRHYGITLSLWLMSMFVALSTDNLGAVLELVGAIAASMLGYILPSMIYLQMHRTELSAACAKWDKTGPDYVVELTARVMAFQPFFLPFFMLAFGLVAMLAGTISTFVDEIVG
ncbi:unnamed protein product [Chrysoparadoxa australica]